MNTNHRTEAERHLSRGSFVSSPDRAHPTDPVATDFHLRMAQIHATLAAGETASADTASYRHAIHTLRFALIRQVGEGLALSEGDEAHQHAAGLAEYLDSVGLNIDREVDAYIDGLGWGDPRDARLSPTDRRAKRDAAPGPWDVKADPWADAPPQPTT
ncbi:hypothetical protein OG875_05215 [Streptomyces sp. NBC_01498]|uniref:hypothetical protein n=1 Tax=Streptomyces sp. NBC_01498 TaxID=2975870 RepID=UPI002E7AC9D1|nr:hypothetical protein [Streptomyces sp. NBC_01498]WTL24058.1 hypothetical protein OG875_05215 [Streptomyces sp. NBC_01498]